MEMVDSQLEQQHHHHHHHHHHNSQQTNVSSQSKSSLQTSASYKTKHHFVLCSSSSSSSSADRHSTTRRTPFHRDPRAPEGDQQQDSAGAGAGAGFAPPPPPPPPTTTTTMKLMGGVGGPRGSSDPPSMFLEDHDYTSPPARRGGSKPAIGASIAAVASGGPPPRQQRRGDPEYVYGITRAGEAEGRAAAAAAVVKTDDDDLQEEEEEEIRNPVDEELGPVPVPVGGGDQRCAGAVATGGVRKFSFRYCGGSNPVKTETSSAAGSDDCSGRRRSTGEGLVDPVPVLEREAAAAVKKSNVFGRINICSKSSPASIQCNQDKYRIVRPNSTRCPAASSTAAASGGVTGGARWSGYADRGSVGRYAPSTAAAAADGLGAGCQDNAQAGMVIPSPFLIQTGLEKTLDFAEFQPMSPSTNKDWNDGQCWSGSNNNNDDADNNTTRDNDDVAKSFDLNSFSCQDVLIYQNSTSNNCQSQAENYLKKLKVASSFVDEDQQTAVFLKGRKAVNVVTKTYELSEYAVRGEQQGSNRRRKMAKRQFEFSSPVPVKVHDETGFDSEWTTPPQYHSKHATAFFDGDGGCSGGGGGGTVKFSSSRKEEKARISRPRKLKKFLDHGKSSLRDDFETDRKFPEFSDATRSAGKRQRPKPPEAGVAQSDHHQSTVAGEPRGKSRRANNGPVEEVTSRDEAHRQGDRESFCSGFAGNGRTRTDHSSDDHEAAAGPTPDGGGGGGSDQFGDLLSATLDQWLEYLMTSQEAMRHLAIDDARFFGYNDDAMEMVGNGDLEVWRILDDMEPEFVRTGIEQYFV